MEISSRALAIARLLSESDEPHVAVGEIAGILGVSAKTVSRELPKVERLLTQHGLRLVKKAGVGLSVEGTTKGLLSLREAFPQVPEKEAYAPEERRRIILGELLPSREPVKLFALAARLKVTDGTVSNDLDKLEGWFAAHGLRLVRKPGLGAYVEGGERELRRAMVRYIYENLSEEQLLALVQGEAAGEEDRRSAAARKYLLDLVDARVIHALEKILHDVERQREGGLSDNAFIGLLVHLSLAVQRIRKQEEIRMDGAFLEELGRKREFRTAQEIAGRMEEAFGIRVPADEVGYITMHLLGARSRYREKGMPTAAVIDNYHLVLLAKGIMHRASEETGRSLSDNQGLLAGLVNHLGPSVSRIKMKMDIRNPLLREMQEQYPDLMALAKKCVVDMERELDAALPDSEIAYIAMHLGAALADGEHFRHMEHRVVVACPTGMGTSRLLASRLQKQFANIRVVDQVSTLRLDADYAARTDFEFAVSTVPIPGCSFPVVVVNALLNGDDAARIEAELQRQKERFFERAAISAERMPFPEALGRMEEYTAAIRQLLGHFFLAEAEAASIVEACRLAGQHTGSGIAAQEGIMQELLAREERGSTVLAGNRMVLLHCRSRFSDALQFGILHLGEGFPYPAEVGEQVRTAIVMLAPQGCSACALETIGHISSVLLDRWRLIEILHEGDKERIEQELMGIFADFYRKKFQELMGDMTV